MILLTTEVVTEAMKRKPDPLVGAWLDTQAAGTLFLASVTLADVQAGIAGLPDGRRRDALEVTLEELVKLFHGRILAFDAEAAGRYGQQCVQVRQLGKSLSQSDGYVCAIAAVRSYKVATRNMAALAATGVAVINPWKAVPVS